jgi:hypothetical protein
MKISDTDYLNGLLKSKKRQLEDAKINKQIADELNRQMVESLQRDIINLELQLGK